MNSSSDSDSISEEIQEVIQSDDTFEDLQVAEINKRATKPLVPKIDMRSFSAIPQRDNMPVPNSAKPLIFTPPPKQKNFQAPFISPRGDDPPKTIRKRKTGLQINPAAPQQQSPYPQPHNSGMVTPSNIQYGDGAGTFRQGKQQKITYNVAPTPRQPNVMQSLTHINRTDLQTTIINYKNNMAMYGDQNPLQQDPSNLNKSEMENMPHKANLADGDTSQREKDTERHREKKKEQEQEDLKKSEDSDLQSSTEDEKSIDENKNETKTDAYSITKYRKGELLGTGANGKVFLGFDLERGKFFAIKEINFSNSDVETLEKKMADIQREISLMKHFSHENIVQYYGAEVVGSTLNIFLEYVTGGSLSSILNKFGRLSEDVVKKYTKQILTGLKYLHDNRVVHRDIKGANILVSVDGFLKLADFGGSRQIQDMKTVSDEFKTLMGTPHFMAPEVILQTGHGRSADIWSVGCTVIEMYTGHPPFFEYKTAAAIMYQIISTNAPPTFPEYVSDLAKDFLLKCLIRDPKRRPTCDDLLKHIWLIDVAEVSEGKKEKKKKKKKKKSSNEEKKEANKDRDAHSNSSDEGTKEREDDGDVSNRISKYSEDTAAQVVVQQQQQQTMQQSILNSLNSLQRGMVVNMNNVYDSVHTPSFNSQSFATPPQIVTPSSTPPNFGQSPMLAVTTPSFTPQGIDFSAVNAKIESIKAAQSPFLQVNQGGVGGGQQIPILLQGNSNNPTNGGAQLQIPMFNNSNMQQNQMVYPNNNNNFGNQMYNNNQNAVNMNPLKLPLPQNFSNNNNQTNAQNPSQNYPYNNQNNQNYNMQNQQYMGNPQFQMQPQMANSPIGYPNAQQYQNNQMIYNNSAGYNAQQGYNNNSGGQMSNPYQNQQYSQNMQQNSNMGFALPNISNINNNNTNQYPSPHQQNNANGYSSPHQLNNNNNQYPSPHQKQNNATGYSSPHQQNNNNTQYPSPHQKQNNATEYSSPHQKQNNATEYPSPHQKQNNATEYSSPHQQNNNNTQHPSPHQQSNTQYPSPHQQNNSNAQYPSPHQQQPQNNNNQYPSPHQKTTNNVPNLPILNPYPSPHQKSPMQQNGPTQYPSPHQIPPGSQNINNPTPTQYPSPHQKPLAAPQTTTTTQNGPTQYPSPHQIPPGSQNNNNQAPTQYPSPHQMLPVAQTNNPTNAPISNNNLITPTPQQISKPTPLNNNNASVNVPTSYTPNPKVPQIPLSTNNAAPKVPQIPLQSANIYDPKVPQIPLQQHPQMMNIFPKSNQDAIPAANIPTTATTTTVLGMKKPVPQQHPPVAAVAQPQQLPQQQQQQRPVAVTPNPAINPTTPLKQPISPYANPNPSNSPIIKQNSNEALKNSGLPPQIKSPIVNKILNQTKQEPIVGSPFPSSISDVVTLDSVSSVTGTNQQSIKQPITSPQKPKDSARDKGVSSARDKDKVISARDKEKATSARDKEKVSSARDSDKQSSSARDSEKSGSARDKKEPVQEKIIVKKLDIQTADVKYIAGNEQLENSPAGPMLTSEKKIKKIISKSSIATKSTAVEPSQMPEIERRYNDTPFPAKPMMIPEISSPQKSLKPVDPKTSKLIGSIFVGEMPGSANSPADYTLNSNKTPKKIVKLDQMDTEAGKKLRKTPQLKPINEMFEPKKKVKSVKPKEGYDDVESIQSFLRMSVDQKKIQIGETLHGMIREHQQFEQQQREGVLLPSAGEIPGRSQKKLAPLNKASMVLNESQDSYVNNSPIMASVKKPGKNSSMGMYLSNNAAANNVGTSKNSGNNVPSEAIIPLAPRKGQTILVANDSRTTTLNLSQEDSVQIPIKKRRNVVELNSPTETYESFPLGSGKKQ